MPPVVPFVIQAVATAAASFVIGKAVSAIAGTGSKSPLRQGSARDVAREVGETAPERASDPLGNAAEPGGALRGLFGKRRIGGKTTLFMKATDGATYVVIVTAGDKLTEISATYLNNFLAQIDSNGWITNSPWTGNCVNVKHYTGGQTAVDPELDAAFPGWDSAYKGTGISYTRVKLVPTANPSAFSAGAPEFTFDAKGFACYDPRNAAHNIADRSTWTFSENAAIIQANHLIHALGCAFPTADIDWTSVAAAADICDESIPLVGGSSEPRYRAAVVWECSERHEDVRDRIGFAHSGGAFIVGKKWRVSTGYFPGATATVEPNQYEAGGLAWSEGAPIAELYNGVRGTFSSPVHASEPRDFPTYQDAAALAEDGRELWLDIQLEAVTSPTQAQRLARIAYNRARSGHRAELETKFDLFDVVADDVVSITDSLAGFTAKTFRVQEETLTPDFTLEFTLEHETAAFYAWTAATDEKPFSVPPPLTGGGAVGGGSVATTSGSAAGDAGGLVAGGVKAYDTNATVGTVALAFAVAPSPSTGALTYEVKQTFTYTTAGVLFRTGVHTPAAIPQTAETTPATFTFGALNGTPSGTVTRVVYEARTVRSGGEATAWATIMDTSTGPNIPTPALDQTTPTTTPHYSLPTPCAPYTTALTSTTATVKTNEVLASLCDVVDFYRGTTSDPNAAALLSTQTNVSGGASVAVTATAGQSFYYWAKARNSASGKTSAFSNPLLIAFA